MRLWFKFLFSQKPTTHKIKSPFNDIAVLPAVQGRAMNETWQNLFWGRKYYGVQITSQLTPVNRAIGRS